MIISYRSKFFVLILIIASLATAGISPACAFISGKESANNHYIEICTSNGSVQVVKVEGDQTPFPPDRPDNKEHTQANKDCAFCFTNAHIKNHFLHTVTTYPPLDKNKPINFLTQQLSLTESIYTAQARAPPAFKI